MSHVATLTLEFKDLNALARAADTLGLDLTRDTKTFRYYGGQKAPCIHKLSLKDAPDGAYEIGLRFNNTEQTSYTLAIDTFGQHGQALQRAVGVDGVKLKQYYAAEVSAAQLRKQGYRVAITTEDQRLRVRATK